MAFGQRVRALREALGLTQAELAVRLGRTSSAVSDMERGKTKSLTAQGLIVFSKTCGANPAWLRTGEGSMFNVSGTFDGLAVLRGLTDDEAALISRLMAIPDDVRAEAYLGLSRVLDEAEKKTTQTLSSAGNYDIFEPAGLKKPGKDGGESFTEII